MTNIWDLQALLSRRLLFWSGLSMLVGVALLLLGAPFWVGLGVQAIAWGAVDGLIALLGRAAARRRRSALPDPTAPAVLDREARKLRHLLWINVLLDLLYVAGGLILTFTLGSAGPGWRGHGWGVTIQGAFLWFFDLVHAQQVPVGVPTGIARLLQGPEHAPFCWGGGRPAALLVHGFPGSPAELRPLATCLHQEGWTVQGLLLPGFGPQIESLPNCGYQDWLQAVRDVLRTLQRDHSPVLLVGYSMGAALSVAAAADLHPEGLALLAPFWRLVSPLQRVGWKVLRPFLPCYVQPLRRLDLSPSEMREAISSFMPQLDLDDPQVREAIRQTSVPVSILDQVDQAGREAYRKAGLVQAALLVVQGVNDRVVLPRHTRRLMRRLGQPAQYVEVEGGHDLLYPTTPAWPAVRETVRAFAACLLDAER